ncbi:MAG TPA: DNA polymerase III subunit gamma/tau [Anaerolineae bacterium]|nr:DNA polymerase III subunit gamma/tau [Anaerolineae bacterium]
MASQALYRKWRSRTFDEIIGQQHVTQTLVNALKLDRVAHAYLFSGPRGTGKTSTARLLAKAVNCLAEDISTRPCNQCAICQAVNEGRLMDLIEIDAASNTGVDDIRDLRDKVGFRPAEANTKFYIIDEVHMLSNSAFNALLKTLEEPPRHVIFVLATTEPEKIPATITSRCQRFDFKRIKLEDVAQRLAYIAGQEGFAATPEALEFIARQSSGSMRDAISLLDQMVAYGGETITLELVQAVLGVVASESVGALVDALIDGAVGKGLDIINQVVSDGLDPRQFAREVVEHLRSVMLVKLGNDANMTKLPEETLAYVRHQAERADIATIIRATTQFNAAAIDIKSGLLAIPQLPLELAFVESVMSTTSPTIPVTTMSESPSSGVPATSSQRQVHRLVQSTPSVSSPPIVGASAPVDLNIDKVRVSFAKVVEIIEPKNKVMAEALRSAQLYKVDGNEIFFITMPLLKKKFEQPIPQKAVNEAFAQALGHSVVVHFLIDQEVAGPPTTHQTDLSLHNLDVDILVKVATEELGGEIIDE